MGEHYPINMRWLSLLLPSPVEVSNMVHLIGVGPDGGTVSGPFDPALFPWATLPTLDIHGPQILNLFINLHTKTLTFALSISSDPECPLETSINQQQTVTKFTKQFTLPRGWTHAITATSTSFFLLHCPQATLCSTKERLADCSQFLHDIFRLKWAEMFTWNVLRRFMFPQG